MNDRIIGQVKRINGPVIEVMGITDAEMFELVRVGEESGQLDSMLIKTAEIYDREVQEKVERLLALLVPVLTITLGLLIAVIIGSILSAFLSINDLALSAPLG